MFNSIYFNRDLDFENQSLLFVWFHKVQQAGWIENLFILPTEQGIFILHDKN